MPGWLEALGVTLSPAIAALVLRLRLMAPNTLPDPSMHTIYIVAPQQVYVRYASVYGAQYLREGARVGFLVPARLAYLAFGAVPGFFVTRYVFALIAVVPVYLLLRRLYSRPAGVAGILVVLSSPVIVTAWGTDYPDSAVVSYVAGALACLAMPCAERWQRRAWLAASGVLLTLAVWAHGVAVPLVGATLVCYVGVRLLRDRAGLLGDLALLAGVAAAVTGLLVAASAVLFGRADFIATTWQSAGILSTPAQVAQFHSANWRWAPYRAYLLVPPAVLGAFAMALTRRGRKVPTSVLIVGVTAAGQFVVFALLQFLGPLEDLEQYFFSSTLWAGVSVAFAVAIAELARPLSGRVARWLPVGAILAVTLGYEADPRPPSFGWLPTGVIVAAAVIAAMAVALATGTLRHRIAAAAGTGLALAAMVGAVLLLTVAQEPASPKLSDTAIDDKPPPYASALGGGYADYVYAYRIATELPGFVGAPAYRSEQILTWFPAKPFFIGYSGMYHAYFNRIKGAPPSITATGWEFLRRRRPAEVLLMLEHTKGFQESLAALAPLRPTLVRTGELRAGRLFVHVWLIRLGAYVS